MSQANDAEDARRIIVRMKLAAFQRAGCLDRIRTRGQDGEPSANCARLAQVRADLAFSFMDAAQADCSDGADAESKETAEG